MLLIETRSLRRIAIACLRFVAPLAVLLWVPMAKAQFGFNDGGFDIQGPPSGSFCYIVNCPAGAWTGNSSGLIVSQSPSWGYPTAVSGGHLAFVQFSGNLRQTFTATASGTFILTWFESDRPVIGSGQTYNVTVNSVVVATYTASEPAFRLRTSAPFTMIAGSTYTVSFQGTSTDDRSVLLDSVKIVIPGEAVTYTYDALGRLVTMFVVDGINNGLNSSYTFDPAGNRTNVTVSGSTP